MHEVESLLNELKGLLSQPSREYVEDTSEVHIPNIFILGCARSGTTILFQILCKYLEVTYPSNFLSRFYFEPHIGAKLQYLLYDLDFKRENLAAFPEFSLGSHLGKTIGPMAPHEFWYYWREIFDIDKLGYITNQTQEQINSFHRGLDSIKEVSGLPLVLKGMIANTTISKIVADRPNDVIIYIKRDTIYNAQSLLAARMNYFGNYESWYSFGVPDSDSFKSPYEEVVGQVNRTNALIELELSRIKGNRIIEVHYEDLNRSLVELMESLPAKIKRPLDTNLTVRNEKKISENEWKELESYISNEST